MKKWWLFILLGILAGCSEENNPVDSEGPDFIYPVAVGNVWEYQALQYNLNIRGDSSHLVSTDTLLSTITVKVTRTAPLADGTNVYAFYEKIAADGGDSVTSILYYRNESNGLYLYAFQQPGFYLPKTQASAPAIPRLKLSALPGLAADSLTFPEAPVQILEYPLQLNARWIYFRRPEMAYNADKLVTNTGTLTTLAGNFECYEIQQLIDINEDGDMDYDYMFYDYVSASGLVKRVIYLYNREIHTSGSLDPLNPPIAIYDQVLVIELKQVSLK